MSYTIFDNEINEKIVKKAKKSKQKFIKKFGDDTNINYHLNLNSNDILNKFDAYNLELSDKHLDISKIKNPIIIGNIRMGFGHYRISLAMVSCAKALGYTPLWLDLNSFKETTCSKVINSQNELYSLGSRLSSRSRLFNKFIWEPLNSEGFRQLKQNVNDEVVSELFIPVLNDLDRSIPYIATHVWPAQAAVHAGFKNIVNAIPDNWQMALHLAEGSTHIIQTPMSYYGYMNLRGMQKDKILKSMPFDAIKEVGHFIDHEIVINIENDTDKRFYRINNNKPLRLLLSIGGAGSQFNLFKGIIEILLPFIKENKVTLFINVGDHLNVLNKLKAEIPYLKDNSIDIENNFKKLEELCNKDVFNTGIYTFYHQNIYEAVYSTNILMRVSDLLLTKPSELSFYPIPKLFIPHVGGHEKWGAIHSAEIGDGTYECNNLNEIKQFLELFINNPKTLINMNQHILDNNKIGIYNGAYKAVKLATKKDD